MNLNRCNAAPALGPIPNSAPLVSTPVPTTLSSNSRASSLQSIFNFPHLSLDSAYNVLGKFFYIYYR